MKGGAAPKLSVASFVAWSVALPFLFDAPKKAPSCSLRELIVEWCVISGLLANIFSLVLGLYLVRIEEVVSTLKGAAAVN
eukprot:1255728-Prymnesium_polylepis.1